MCVVSIFGASRKHGNADDATIGGCWPLCFQRRQRMETYMGYFIRTQKLDKQFVPLTSWNIERDFEKLAALKNRNIMSFDMALFPQSYSLIL